MSKAKINFEIEQESRANAKACVAKHGGSLNKLVSSLFARLGQDERLGTPAIDPAKRVLPNVTAGKISIMEAAQLLEFPDAGYVLHRLRDERLPLLLELYSVCRLQIVAGQQIRPIGLSMH